MPCRERRPPLMWPLVLLLLPAPWAHLVFSACNLSRLLGQIAGPSGGRAAAAPAVAADGPRGRELDSRCPPGDGRPLVPGAAVHDDLCRCVAMLVHQLEQLRSITGREAHAAVRCGLPEQSDGACAVESRAAMEEDRV